jgi:hypothetical protein
MFSGSPLFKANLSSSKYILDSELNLSLVMDSLNLILTNDIEDDEDAYDTLQMALGKTVQFRFIGIKWKKEHPDKVSSKLRYLRVNMFQHLMMPLN